jgi:hypothetical protein
MRYIKHNAIENFNQSSPQEKANLLVEEMSKAYMLYPQAVADILDSTNIKYKSKHPEDLAEAVKANSGNLKMLNRVVRLSYLVNKDNNGTSKEHNRNSSYRDLMREGKSFLKNYPNQLKESTLIARDMMKEDLYSKVLNKTMSNYLNMDGQEQKKLEPPQSITPYVVVGLLLVGAFLLYQKSKK